jgi:hypothetical protein
MDSLFRKKHPQAEEARSPVSTRRDLPIASPVAATWGTIDPKMTLPLIEQTFLSLVRLKAAGKETALEVDRLYFQLHAKQYQGSAFQNEVSDETSSEVQFPAMIIMGFTKAKRTSEKAATSPYAKNRRFSFKAAEQRTSSLDQNGLDTNSPLYANLMLTMKALTNILRKSANAALIITRYLKELDPSDDETSWGNLAEKTARTTLSILTSNIHHTSQVKKAAFWLKILKQDFKITKKAYLRAHDIFSQIIGSP